MRLKVWDLSKKENERLWLNEDQVKIIGINEENELWYYDKYENFHIVCEIRKGIDVFEVEEK